MPACATQIGCDLCKAAGTAGHGQEQHADDLALTLCHAQGLVFEGRTEGTNTPEKMEFARSAEDGARLSGASLKDAVATVQPTALIGAAAARKPREVLQALVAAAEARCGDNARPVVLALSNPSDVAECTAQVSSINTCNTRLHYTQHGAPDIMLIIGRNVSGSSSLCNNHTTAVPRTLLLT